jgi:alkylhydroperoxidase family enzyme
MPHDGETPRIAPGDSSTLSLPVRVFGQIAQRVTKSDHPPNLFATLGKHPGLFWGWLRFAQKLMPRGKLPRRDTELVILRVAHLRTATYEWTHHVKLGKQAGLTDADIDRIQAEGLEGWDERERTLLTAVDELHTTGDLTDATFGAVHRTLGDKLTIELVMLVGHYEMLATFLNTLRIQPD